MGIADLMPGISGGTIAFISGIYEELLESIKNLQFHALKKIVTIHEPAEPLEKSHFAKMGADSHHREGVKQKDISPEQSQRVAWPFLLPLGAGIITAILLFSKCVYFLLQNYPGPLLGFLFGLIAASTLIYTRSAGLKRPQNWVALASGAVVSYGLTILPCQQLFEAHFLSILLAGMLGVGGMLLPGVSGSYILQVIGVYPLVIYALNSPGAPGSLKLLIAMGIGIALGFIVFSRLISLLLAHFHQITMAVLVGFMVGGLKVLWPFGREAIFGPCICVCAGFVVIIILEVSMKRLRIRSRSFNSGI